MSVELRAPFPYPGGKAKAAPLVWRALGDVASYLEPFAGSCAVLLSRPHAPKYELINDSNGLVMNAWRAIRYQPDLTATFCADPPNEADLRARVKWLKARAEAHLAGQLETYAQYCDPQAAGWWIWCQAVGLGPDWFSQPRPSMIKPYRRGILSPEAPPAFEWFSALQTRLQNVGMACGDWERLVTESALGFNNTGTTPTGIFGDPPYPDEDIDYGSAPDTAKRFADWCREHGDDKRLRIVLAGHIGDYDLPGWRVVNWGGSRGWGRERRGDNEALYLSPHCHELLDAQPSLFKEVV